MKRILVSLSIIAAVAAVVVGATTAWFSDTETSTGNTLSAGTIDIDVDGQNPWTKTFINELKDMKPSQVRYIVFTIHNKGENPARIYKHIKITDQNDGVNTEPECDEGKGTWNETTKACDGNYVPRFNLAAYTLYDMYVCRYTGEQPPTDKCQTEPNTGKPVGNGWEPIIKENQYVRLDNVNSAYIYLGNLEKSHKLKVVQSYHLSSWPGAPEADVTNWAQGDVMTFDIELMATQLNAPGPKGYQTTLTLDNKDDNWNPVNDDIQATLTYKTSGEKFDYSLSGKVKNASTEYCLIYYADPWPGDGTDHTTGALIGKATSDGSKNISIPSTHVELGTDLPNAKDQNYPAGAKVWLIPCTHYSATTAGQQGHMTAWTPSEYLFEMQFITYDDTEIP